MTLPPGNAKIQAESSVPDGSPQAGLAEILQLCCLSRRSGQITFQSHGSSGFVYLLHGRVIHALCGSLEGEEAVFRMLSWSPGGYTLNEEIQPQDTTIALSWEHLLLEGARRVDQGIDPGAPPKTSPVVTTTPATSSRVKANLPKIILTLPGERPRTYELEAEYTHVGRASGNEVPLADPSVSNRHCIFILHGADVVLRDLNSSNGTVVNGQAISEAVLRPGDLIQVGVVQMKFEPGVRRPKLTQGASSPFGDKSDLSAVTELPASRTTLKLPQSVPRTARPAVIKDDSVFVKGESAISYDNLEKPPAPVKSRPVLLIVLGVVVLLCALAGGYYYFFLRAH